MKTRTGSAAPTHGTVAQVRSKYKISHKVSYTNNGPRNADASGTWNILDMFTTNDYGKKNIIMKNNNRVLNNKNEKGQHVLNLSAPNKKSTARNNQKLKDTKHGALIKNKRMTGNYQGSKKSIVYDPNDLARPTIKETQVHNQHSGNMNQSMYKGIAYDPNDIAKTTVKETNIDNNHNGVLTGGLKKGFVYDPNDIARTTIKETNINNNHNGNINSLTKKGTYIQNGETAKVTMKQTTMIKDAMGIATKTRNDGYIHTTVQAPETIRQNTSVYYTGDATGPELGAYDVTEVEATNTNRQFTADTEYFGGVGNDGVNTKPMSYEDIYNAEIKALRGVQDEGYTPGAMGPNEVVGSQSLNITTSKIGDIQNKYLNERGVQATKVYNSIPQMNLSNLTQEKEIVPNEPLADRINPEYVNAFRENPYTQSLNSWA